MSELAANPSRTAAVDSAGSHRSIAPSRSRDPRPVTPLRVSPLFGLPRRPVAALLAAGLPKATMCDFLHLSEKGYAIWADAIAKTVEEMVK